MPAFTKFEQIVAWQLGVTLRNRIYDLTSGGEVARDGGFVEQIRDSSSSIPRNIAEGFAKYNPAEFGRYVNIAKGSLAETQTHLQHGRDVKYWTEEQFEEMWRISCRAMRAVARLHAYLRSAPAKANARRASTEPRRNT